MNRGKDVLVFLESSGEDRQVTNQGLISEGRMIGKCLGGSLSALAFESIPEDPSMLEAFGVSTLYLLKGELLKEYRCEVFSWAMREFLLKNSPRLFLLAHSDRSRELAPRVAYALQSSAVTGCSDIRVKEGCVFFTKPVYEGQFEQEVSFSAGLLEIATLRPEVLNRQKSLEVMSLDVKEIHIDVPVEIAYTNSLELIAPDFKTIDIEHAKRIIGVGTGAADEETLLLIHELSELVEGSLGTTRPMVDDGHLPKERLIGQTGKQIAPDLYLALGISGSSHHVAGIQDARKIISINKDPSAPIWQFSDQGFVGDLKRILPKLLDRIQKWRSISSHEE
jgi:electron transfer flavoprotein alpha subunit